MLSLGFFFLGLVPLAYFLPWGSFPKALSFQILAGLLRWAIIRPRYLFTSVTDSGNGNAAPLALCLLLSAATSSTFVILSLFTLLGLPWEDFASCATWTGWGDVGISRVEGMGEQSLEIRPPVALSLDPCGVESLLSFISVVKDVNDTPPPMGSFYSKHFSISSHSANWSNCGTCLETSSSEWQRNTEMWVSWKTQGLQWPSEAYIFPPVPHRLCFLQIFEKALS